MHAVLSFNAIPPARLMASQAALVPAAPAQELVDEPGCFVIAVEPIKSAILETILRLLAACAAAFCRADCAVRRLIAIASFVSAVLFAPAVPDVVTIAAA